MDASLAKLIQSRKKSIAVLEKDVADFESKASFASSPSGVLVLKEVVKVKNQRLAKLREELAGLEELARAAQPELPGTAPAAPKPPPGRR